MKRAWADPYSKFNTPGFGKMRSKSAKAQWKNPKVRAKTIQSHYRHWAWKRSGAALEMLTQN